MENSAVAAGGAADKKKQLGIGENNTPTQNEFQNNLRRRNKSPF